MPGLPATVDDLTPAWLSGAIGAPVAAVEVLDHAFATNQRARLALVPAPGADAPGSVFVKLAPLDAAHRQMIGAIGMGEREIRFYADVAGSLGLLVPRCWYAAAEGELFVLVLEDLAARGCRFSDGSWGVDADAAARALEELAAFHARFGDPSTRAAVAPWLAAPSRRSSEATARLMRTVLDQQAGRLTPAYAAVGERYVAHHAWLDAQWHGGPQTYIHGDLHIGNVFLDGRRVGFLDWGLSRVSTPLRDVSYFLTMSVSIDERRSHERALLQGYLDALRIAGGPDISFDEAWATHRLQAAYTVVATFLAYMPSYASGDGVSLGDALLGRANAAVEDLEVIDAIDAAR